MKKLLTILPMLDTLDARKRSVNSQDQPESLGFWQRLESANLLGPTAGFRDLPGPHPGRVLVGHIHHGQSPQKLLGLDEGPVGERQRAAGGVGAEDRAVL